jgi:hypothetical protein
MKNRIITIKELSEMQNPSKTHYVITFIIAQDGIEYHLALKKGVYLLYTPGLSAQLALTADIPLTEKAIRDYLDSQINTNEKITGREIGSVEKVMIIDRQSE